MPEVAPSQLENLKATYRKAASQYADETLRKYVGDADFEKYKAAGAQEIRALIEENIETLAGIAFKDGFGVTMKDARDVLEGGNFYKEVQEVADKVSAAHPDWIQI